MASQFSNIGGHQDDPFFRYKMPNITTKVEGSGKMIKTFVSNLDILASSLKRQPDVILKYLGYARNVNVNLNKGYISGSHSIADLTRHLHAFISNFVLCAQCGYPEALLSVTSKKQLVHNCNACGHHAQLNIGAGDVAGQKLAEFIIKNNKPVETSKKDKKNATRAAGKSKKGGKAEDTDGAPPSSSDSPPSPSEGRSAASAPPPPEDVPMALQGRLMMPADMSDAALLAAAEESDARFDAQDGQSGDGSDDSDD